MATDRKRDKKTGRFTTNGPPRDKQINIKVNAADYKAIQALKEKGINPRDVIVQVANNA